MVRVRTVDFRRILREQDGGDDEGDAVAQVSKDERPATTSVINDKHTQSLRTEGNDGIVCLVLQRVAAADTHLAIDCDRIVSATRLAMLSPES